MNFELAVGLRRTAAPADAITSAALRRAARLVLAAPMADRRSQQQDLRRADRERADPDSLRLEHDHSPVFDTRRYLAKIGEQKFELCIRMPWRRPAKQNHRWSLRIPQCKQRSEVGVG